MTLPATGSEMNCGSVVTRRSLKAKLHFASPLVFPLFSVLDPEKTYTLPQRQISNGVVDSFVHVVEQYMIEHELTAMYGFDHARTLAIILPSVLTVCRDMKRRHPRFSGTAAGAWDGSPG